ncbi:MAG TPA: phosphoribosyltransferase family protein, partial [Actinotalea sp.]
VVLGYAETATALGQCVAEALGAPGLHSTRRPVAGLAPAGGFEEEHSHATSHLLLPRDPALLRNPVPLVLVDDELSTGRTVMNTIAALQAQTPRERYVIASLVDVRDDEARGELAARALALGVRVDTVALVEGRVVTADDTQARAASLLAAIDERAPATAEASAPPQFGAPAPAVSRITVPWPADLPETARHGTSTDDVRALDRLLPELVEPLLTTVRAAQHIVHRVLVLGTEELMYAPLRLAAGLADALDAGGDGVEVRFSTTTRSPVLVVDEPGYPIRSGVRFPAHDDPADGPGPRFAYNVAGGGFDLVLVVTDAAGDTEDLRAPGGLLSQLDAAEVALITLPTAHAHAHSHEGARA